MCACVLVCVRECVRARVHAHHPPIPLSYIDRLSELFKRHPKLMLSCDRHGMPMVVWAARCRSRDALAAVLNAGAPIKTEFNGSSLMQIRSKPKPLTLQP